MAVELRDFSWQRMIEAVQAVRERALRATAALERAGIPYAVAGGNAVAAWVSRVDRAAVRNTQDVDILVRRSDFEAVNGFDERFVGWGQEDDDLGLRLRAAGVRLETILGQTRSLHVWHETDATATSRWRDGVNVRYFERRGRLTACRLGLIARPAAAITWGLPADLMTTPLGRSIARHLAGATVAAEGKPCEIELVVRPGTGRFTRQSECRLALVAAHQSAEGNLAREADTIVAVAGDEAIVAALAAVG